MMLCVSAVGIAPQLSTVYFHSHNTSTSTLNRKGQAGWQAVCQQWLSYRDPDSYISHVFLPRVALSPLPYTTPTIASKELFFLSFSLSFLIRISFNAAHTCCCLLTSGPLSHQQQHNPWPSDTRSPFNSLLDIECALTITAVVSRCIDFDFIHSSPTAFFWGFSYS